jgi:hypothetical protein
MRGAVLFSIAAIARAVCLFALRPPLESYYLGLADSLLRTGALGFDGTPSTAFEPVYPAFLAAAALLTGNRPLLIQLMQVCVAALGAPLLYRLALRLNASRSAATLAGLLFAVHPLLVKQASGASDLALTTVIVIGFALTFVRIRGVRTAAMAGAVLGLAVLTRSMMAPLVVLSGGILLARGLRFEALALTLAALAAIGPMVMRNYALTGSLSPSRSGVNLYIGNSPHTASLLPTYDLDLLEPEAYERFRAARPEIHPDAPTFDVELDELLTHLAVRHMLTDPRRTVGQKLLNVAYVLSPRLAPFRISTRDTRVIIDENGTARVVDSAARSPIDVWPYAAFTVVLLAGTVLGVVRRRGNLGGDAILWAVAVTVICINAVYVPATRYIAPMLFVMMFYTAVALDATALHWLRRRSEDRHLAA